ncbi:MAG: hypothetical protein MUC49_21035 [Raineya sp.]|nr:hypothetical protein [Raineya sp.]
MTTNEEKLANYLYFKNPNKFCKDLEERNIIDKSTTSYILKTLAAPEGMLFAIILNNTLVEYEDTFNIEHFSSYRYLKAAREGKRIDGIMAGLRYYTPGFFATTIEEAQNHINIVHEKKMKGIGMDKYENIQNRMKKIMLCLLFSANM